MASIASQLIKEVTAHAQSDSFENAREIYADGTYFPNPGGEAYIKPRTTGWETVIQTSFHN